MVLGLALTGFLTRHPVRGFTFFRTVLFLPQTIAGVVIAQAFVWFYAEEGPFNAALKQVAPDEWARGWLGDFDWALRAIGSIGTWVTFGLCMVLFVAGVQKIPTSLYDAARVDGAGAVREFLTVTLPGLRYELVVAFVLTTINALRSFDIVYNATKGGPGRRDLRAGAADVPERVQVQRRRVRLRDRRHPGRGDLRASRPPSTSSPIAVRPDARVDVRAHDHVRRAGGVHDRGHLPDPARSCSSRCIARKTS